MLCWSATTARCGKSFSGAARAVCEKHYGNKVFARGLIEFTSYCKNDCFYCGLRRSNSKAQRYRLSFGEILERCESGYALGFRTFVLQGGEDGYFDDESICRIVREIKRRCVGLRGHPVVGRKTD